jgi:Heterokaryon incompatibility protein (HET)
MHSRCCRLQNSGCFIPDRLLDIQPVNKSSGFFSIVEGVQLHGISAYGCLSHCWGSQQPFTLTQSSYDELKNGIAVLKLPATFRDAIEVCRWLEIRYLWIDSLCIIQDSKADWRRQAFQMRNIYKHAYLTIAATHAPNSSVGLFRERNPASVVVPLFQVTHLDTDVETEGKTVGVLDELLWEHEVELAPLNQRAWVLQVCMIFLSYAHQF